MGSRFYQRPENAISKADEFIKVGKPTRALDTLYEVIKSKSKRHTVSERLIEQIMFKYLELCVDLKKSHIAKEGLFQYRNLCQVTNVASLASVVQGYLNMAEKRTDSAKQESVETAQDIDDLENLATPEMIMLSAVSGEDSQDRSDRKILMPWVKFLWESYCQCLELLRTNARVERLYHDIAQQAFRFCLKYQRKTEFRKLCDKLRNHLDLILKQPVSPMSINLNNAETQQWNLDTRLAQLDAAIQMELWQEAYKAIEDIHGLMMLSKKVFQPKMMANYYQKLALVFWKSGNHLFHAAALAKHFQLTREMKKNISADELGKMASRVLLACLAVPIPSQHPEFDSFIETDRTPQEKMARLAILLSLQQPPTRQSLLTDCVRFGVIPAALPQLRNLYQWLEVEFHPLKLCKRVEAEVGAISQNDELSALVQYIPALKDVTLVRLLKQVSQIYQTIEFNRLLALAPFSNTLALERIIVDCVRHNDLQIRIDHRTRTVTFGTDFTEAQSYDVAEGPHLQDMPSEQIRTQLMKMMDVLDQSIKTIMPEKLREENQQMRLKIVEAYHQSKHRDHQRILNRHKIIEERKEYLEKLSIHREAEEQRKQEQQMRERIKQEEERLKAEQIAREQMQNQMKLKKIQEESVKQKLQQISQTAIGQKILEEMDEKEIAELDTDKIMAKQVEEIEKEKRELIARLKAQEKKIDHMERAKRREEIPLLQKSIEKDKEEDKVFWREKEKERIKQAIADRELAIATRDRMIRMKDDRDAYLSDLLKQRKAVFDKKLKEFNEKLTKERQIRLEERKKQRYEERRAKWIREKEEEAQRIRDEELKRQKEEEARLEAERRAKEEEEYRKKKEKLDEIAEKKQQREREIEEKLRQRDEASQPPPGRPGPRSDTRDGWRRDTAEPSGPPGGSWRDRERGAAGGPPDRESGPPSRGGAWRGGGGGGWRDRERQKDDDWLARRRPDDEERERGGERGPPMRRDAPRRGEPDVSDNWRRDAGPPRDDRDRRPPPPRGGPPPRRDMDDRGPRGDLGDWRRRDDRDDRGPPPMRRDDRGPRGGPPPRRDDRGGPRSARDDDRDWRNAGPRRDDRRGPPPPDDRRGPPPDDRRGPPPGPRDEPRRGGDQDDDGWTKVKVKR